MRWIDVYITKPKNSSHVEEELPQIFFFLYPCFLCSYGCLRKKWTCRFGTSYVAVKICVLHGRRHFVFAYRDAHKQTALIKKKKQILSRTQHHQSLLHDSLPTTTPVADAAGASSRCKHPAFCGSSHTTHANRMQPPQLRQYSFTTTTLNDNLPPP